MNTRFFIIISFGIIVDIVKGNLTIVMEKTLPAYTIAINSNLLMNSSKCRIELDLFREGVDNHKLWSLKSR